MSTSSKQDKDFKDSIEHEVTVSINSSILETSIDWIKENMDIGSVFTDDEIRDYCRDSSEPEDVFSESSLDKWAEANGYIKE